MIVGLSCPVPCHWDDHLFATLLYQKASLAAGFDNWFPTAIDCLFQRENCFNFVSESHSFSRFLSHLYQRVVERSKITMDNQLPIIPLCKSQQQTKNQYEAFYFTDVGCFSEFFPCIGIVCWTGKWNDSVFSPRWLHSHKCTRVYINRKTSFDQYHRHGFR